MSDTANAALEQLALVGARTLYANLSITMVGAGEQIPSFCRCLNFV